MSMTESILQEFNIKQKTHCINSDNGSNIRRALMDLSHVEVETEEVDMNMNTHTEEGGFANEVVDEFLPEVLTAVADGELELEAVAGETDLQKEDEERQHFIHQLEDEVRDFVNAKRIYDLTPLRCIAHLLQLPILKILHKDHPDNVFVELLAKVRKMVGKYSKSVNAKSELYKMVKLLVVTYVVTRWWSDVDMMDRLRRINKVNSKALNKVITKCEWEEELLLTTEDFDLLEKFLALFKPIKKMADQLNGEAYSTINLVLPTVKDIKSHIDSFKKDKLISVAAKTLSKEFDKYFRYLLFLGKLCLYLICQLAATSTQQRMGTTRDYMLLPPSFLLYTPTCCQKQRRSWRGTTSRSRFRSSSHRRRRRRPPGRQRRTRTRRLAIPMTRRTPVESTFLGLVCWTISTHVT